MALRLMAEAGDLRSAYKLGVLLVEQQRYGEAESWLLRRVIHTEHGSEAGAIGR
jgi:hypothetical protein